MHMNSDRKIEHGSQCCSTVDRPTQAGNSCTKLAPVFYFPMTVHDILFTNFEMFHWLLGWYTSYCAAPLVAGTSERKHNKVSRPIGRHAV